MAVKYAQGTKATIICLSTDTKAETYPDGTPISIGSTLTESDTSNQFLWDGLAWRRVRTITAIRYNWADVTARNAQTGMATLDIGRQEDTNILYMYNGANWSLFMTLG